jgi:bifunctional non-homologous end joining protein LigD
MPAKKSAVFDLFIPPMLARLSTRVPTSEFAYEVKWDGVRAVVYVGNGKLRILSRNHLDVTGAYPELAALPKHLHARDAILDGEIVALDAEGLPSFSRLQRRMHVRSAAAQGLSQSHGVTYMFFDLLYLNGTSLTDKPYLERRAKLIELKLEGEHWSTPENYIGDAGPFMSATQELGLEGIIAKKANSPYYPGKRTDAWVKIKHVHKQEFVIGGWQDGQGSRLGVPGSLLLGYYDCTPEEARRNNRAQKLTYAGKVGTGFSDRMLSDIHVELRRRELASNPFEIRTPRERNIHFAKPELVAEIRFGSWTHDDILRHASFQGLREDKSAAEVVREN